MRTRMGLLRRLLLTAAPLALFAAFAGWAQEGQPAERHYWIVLLDVSASFEERQAGAGTGLPAGYRLRNELPSLLHTLLAARNHAEGGKREDYLSVYFFGRGVHPVEGVQAERVHWGVPGEEKNDAWWEARQAALPPGTRARSDLRMALARAVDDFRRKPAGWGKHLVLISDGEMDVDGAGRDPGKPPQAEELAAYDELLNPGSGPMAWLQEHQVTIHTLAVDEAWNGSYDGFRQSEIRSELNDSSLQGGTLERANELIRRRVRDLVRRPYRSEGPVVMQALAEGPGTQQSFSRSVRSENLSRVLWETFFPQTPEQPYVAPGTRMLLVLAPVGEPVVLEMEGSIEPVTLRYDPATGQPAIAGDPERRITRYSARRSAQHVTWIIESRSVAHVRAGSQVRMVPVNNADLRWRPGRPPRVTARGQTVPVEAELVWEPGVPGDDLAAWRRRLRQEVNGMEATVEVSAPGAREPIRIPLRPELVDDSSLVLLRLVGEYTGTQAAGMHALTGVLQAGEGDDRWEERLASTLVEVSAQPAARPELFVAAGQGAEPLRLAPLPERASLPGGRERPLLLHFSTAPPAQAPGGARAPEAVPDVLAVVDESGREIGRAAPLSAESAGAGTRYRFSPLQVPDSVLGRELRVRVLAGAATYEYGLVVSRGGGPRRWPWIALALLLAGLLLVAYRLTRPPVKRNVPPFDFTVQVNGRPVQLPEGKQIVLEPSDGDGVTVHHKPSGRSDAVRFAAEAGEAYRLAPVGQRTGWLYRRVHPVEDDACPFVPLREGGVTMTRSQVLRGWRYQLRHGDRHVEIRRNGQPAMPASEEFTRTIG